MDPGSPFRSAQSVVIILNNITIDCLSYNNVVLVCLPVLEQLRVWKFALVWSNISVRLRTHITLVSVQVYESTVLTIRRNAPREFWINATADCYVSLRSYDDQGRPARLQILKNQGCGRRYLSNEAAPEDAAIVEPLPISVPNRSVVDNFSVRQLSEELI